MSIIQFDFGFAQIFSNLIIALRRGDFKHGVLATIHHFHKTVDLRKLKNNNIDNINRAYTRISRGRKSRSFVLYCLIIRFHVFT
jgi:hypothetical protein